MLAISNPYSTFRRLHTVTGVMSWFVVVLGGVAALWFAIDFAVTDGTEDPAGGGFIFLSIVWGIFCIVLVGGGFFVMLETEDPFGFPFQVAIAALGAWILCGGNYYFWPTRQVEKSDMVRIRIDGSVQRFGDPAIPRGVFRVQSIPLPRSYSFTDVYNAKEGAATIKETVTIDVTLRNDRIEDLVRELKFVIPSTGGSGLRFNKDRPPVGDTLKEIAAQQIKDKRTKGEAVVSGALELKRDWIESVVISKVVRERTESRTEVR